MQYLSSHLFHLAPVEDPVAGPSAAFYQLVKQVDEVLVVGSLRKLHVASVFHVRRKLLCNTACGVASADEFLGSIAVWRVITNYGSETREMKTDDMKRREKRAERMMWNGCVA